MTPKPESDEGPEPAEPKAPYAAEPQWLAWARRLQALSQSGLHYCDDVFDRERYDEVARIAAAIMAGHSEATAAQVERFFSEEVGYATPKTDLRAVVLRDGKLLLVRERSDGLWSLPGGWADVGETPAACVEKEVLEETGFRSRAVKLLALYDQRKRGAKPHPLHSYKAFFRCEIIDGAARPSIETSEVDFFAEDALPDLSTGRVTAEQLARMFAHHRNPDWPTDFD
ncbi:NUDIX hydrolase [Pelagibius litoralis]|uniref:NUDIX hydrolase n=1 Tax=Pelagibius litoralis TaxID=374515 RepID=A0A967EZW7_9PROT|nr:NUDIX hydrolase [Pelagibius litoralis]NIA70463.1 NUDIX hydrolase [Pelagibius litoralis]